MPPGNGGRCLPAPELPDGEPRGPLPHCRVGQVRQPSKSNLGAAGLAEVPAEEAVRAVLGTSQQRYPVPPDQTDLEDIYYPRPRAPETPTPVPLPATRLRGSIPRVDPCRTAAQRHRAHCLEVLGARHTASLPTPGNRDSPCVPRSART